MYSHPNTCLEICRHCVPIMLNLKVDIPSIFGRSEVFKNCSLHTC